PTLVENTIDIDHTHQHQDPARQTESPGFYQSPDDLDAYQFIPMYRGTDEHHRTGLFAGYDMHGHRYIGVGVQLYDRDIDLRCSSWRYNVSGDYNVGHDAIPCLLSCCYGV